MSTHSSIDDPTLKALTEALNDRLIAALKPVVPPDTGYVLTTFPADEERDGVVTYASNVDWTAAARRMRQLANNIEDERSPRALDPEDWNKMVEQAAGTLHRLVHAVTWDPSAAVTILALVMGITALVEAMDDEAAERLSDLVDEVFHLVNSMLVRGVDVNVRFSKHEAPAEPDEVPPS